MPCPCNHRELASSRNCASTQRPGRQPVFQVNLTATTTARNTRSAPRHTVVVSGLPTRLNPTRLNSAVADTDRRSVVAWRKGTLALRAGGRQKP
jgi:hypothetical protein